MPIGAVPEELLAATERTVAEWFPFDPYRLPPLPMPAAAWQPERGQYESVTIMKALAAACPPDAARLLGLTTADIAIPMLSFLFGQAQFNGPIALVSVSRLRQDFYGLPPDGELLVERLAKEVLHELGHTCGLIHCADPQCAMSLSTHVGLVDAKQASFCAVCGSHLVRRLTSSNG
ncbi:MAG TPA: hypothetical protein VGK29_04835 [Paludibaculum sp.]|jgi:archaemetzincin